VLEQLDRLRNEEANFENLTILRERNEALANAGRLTDIQVDQARQDELSAEDRVVAARRDLAASLDALKFDLGLPIDVDLVLEESGLRSLEAWPALAEDLPEDLVLAIGLERRLDHATFVDRVDDAARGAKVAADSLRTGLDFAGSAVIVSDPDDPGSLDADDIGPFLGGVEMPSRRQITRSSSLDRAWLSAIEGTGAMWSISASGTRISPSGSISTRPASISRFSSSATSAMSARPVWNRSSSSVILPPWVTASCSSRQPITPAPSTASM
jgi:outer membrane protein TolC